VKTKNRLLFNLVVPVLLQLVTILVNLVIPRMIILNYGSSINGLFSTAQQISQALYLLEGGIAVAVAAQLYRPIREKCWDEVSRVLTSAKKYYTRMSYLFLVLSLIICTLMAVYLRENVNPIRSFAVIFITSLQYLLSLSLMSRINVIQVADGRAYIKNINAVVGRTFGFIFQYALISIHADYVLVKFAEVFAMMIAVLPAVYIHFKDYRQISFRHSDPIAVKSQTSALLLQLTQMGARSLPGILAVLLFDLRAASIISVYVLIFHFGNSIIEMVSQSYAAFFSRVFGASELEAVRKKTDILDFITWFSSGVLLICFLNLTYPFVKIYTHGADIDYHLPYAVGILAVTEFFRNLCFIPRTAFLSLGNLELLSKSSIYELALGVFGGVIGALAIGLPGILIGLLIGSLMRFLYLSHSFNKIILHQSIKIQLVSNLRYAIFIIISWVLTLQIEVSDKAFIRWISDSFFVTFVAAVFIFAGFALLNQKTAVKILVSFRNQLFGRKG